MPLLLAAAGLDKSIAANQCVLDTTPIQLMPDSFPLFFLLLPRLVLTYYSTEFLHSLPQLLESPNLYSAVIQDASRFSNWLMAGLYNFLSSCSVENDMYPAIHVMELLFQHPKLFVFVTETDIVTLLRLSCFKKEIIDKMQALFQNKPYSSLFYLLCVVLSPSDDCEQMLPFIVSKCERSAVILCSFLHRLLCKEAHSPSI